MAEPAARRYTRMQLTLAALLLAAGVWLWGAVAWWLGLFHLFLGGNRLLRPFLPRSALVPLRYAEWTAAAVVTAAVLLRHS